MTRPFPAARPAGSATSRAGRDGTGRLRRWQQVVAVQDGVQAVLGLGGQADHLAALGDRAPASRAPPGAEPRCR